MKINRILLAALGGLVFSGIAATAHAETVVYSTTGAFAGDIAGETQPLGATIAGSNTAISSITVTSAAGTATITFDGEVADSVDAPTYNPLGTFIVSSTASSANPVDLSGLSFTLTVDQTIPSLGGGSFGTGSVTGTISTTSSGTFVTFASPTIIGPFDGVTYGLLYNPVELVAPSSGGTTTVQGDIEAPSVPVPASMLGGAALMGMLLVSKKLNRRSIA